MPVCLQGDCGDCAWPVLQPVHPVQEAAAGRAPGRPQERQRILGAFPHGAGSTQAADAGHWRRRVLRVCSRRLCGQGRVPASAESPNVHVGAGRRRRLVFLLSFKFIESVPVHKHVLYLRFES